VGPPNAGDSILLWATGMMTVIKAPVRLTLAFQIDACDV
jgi:hypothetical protein